MSFSIFTIIYNQHHGQFLNIFTTSKSYCFWIFHMNWIHVICAWFLPLSIIFSKLIQVAACISTLFLFDWIILHCIDTLHYIYPLIKWWTSGLFPFFGYSEKCFHKHLWTSFYADLLSFLLGIHLYTPFNHFKKYQTIFPN